MVASEYFIVKMNFMRNVELMDFITFGKIYFVLRELNMYAPMKLTTEGRSGLTLIC